MGEVCVCVCMMCVCVGGGEEDEKKGLGRVLIHPPTGACAGPKYQFLVDSN